MGSCVADVARTRRRAIAAPCYVEHLRGCSRKFFGEEVRLLIELIVLGLLMYEPHPIIQGQVVAHFPVVLDVKFQLIVEHAAFDVFRSLTVRIEDSQSRVGETEPAVEGVIRVIAEIHVTREGRVEAGVLRLITVVEVGPGLEGVAPLDLRQPG